MLLLWKLFGEWFLFQKIVINYFIIVYNMLWGTRDFFCQRDQWIKINICTTWHFIKFIPSRLFRSEPFKKEMNQELQYYMSIIERKAKQRLTVCLHNLSSKKEGRWSLFFFILIQNSKKKIIINISFSQQILQLYKEQ